jgi:hypothetical protein
VADADDALVSPPRRSRYGPTVWRHDDAAAAGGGHELAGALLPKWQAVMQEELVLVRAAAAAAAGGHGSSPSGRRRGPSQGGGGRSTTLARAGEEIIGAASQLGLIHEHVAALTAKIDYHHHHQRGSGGGGGHLAQTQAQALSDRLRRAAQVLPHRRGLPYLPATQAAPPAHPGPTGSGAPGHGLPRRDDSQAFDDGPPTPAQDVIEGGYRPPAPRRQRWRHPARLTKLLPALDETQSFARALALAPTERRVEFPPITPANALTPHEVLVRQATVAAAATATLGGSGSGGGGGGGLRLAASVDHDHQTTTEDSSSEQSLQLQ